MWPSQITVHPDDTSWKRLEDIFARRLEDVLKTPWIRLEYVSKTFLQDVLKTSWKRLEDILKRYGQDDYIGLDQDVIWRRMSKVNYSSWSRRLKDVFWRQRWKTSSRRLHQGQCFLSKDRKQRLKQPENVFTRQQLLLNVFKFISIESL